jgi:hypothetical protein
MVSVTEMIMARATATAAHVTTSDIPNWGPTIIAVSMSLTCVAFILVLLRLITRWRLSQLGWDDLCIVIAIVSCPSISGECIANPRLSDLLLWPYYQRCYL